MPEETPEPAPSTQETSPELIRSTGASPEPIASQPAVQYGSEPPIEESSRAPYVAFIAFAGWLVPGLGHLFQRRWGRAAIGFVAVGAMALAGLWMRGNVFAPQRGDAFGLLGFIADAGAGVFYLLAHTIQKAGADVSHAAGDYGTRMLATAGVLNLLFVLDALEVSRGKKN
ncbi:MAG: DUF6677 family protein [Candidatus Acidiferrales bacterium]